MIDDARLILAKDLRIERSSRVLTTQILPFGVIVLILFGFGVSPDHRVVGPENRSVLTQTSPGLFWLAVFFAALLAFNRSFAVESEDGNLDALRMAGLNPGGIFLGKAGAIFVQLVALEVLLGVGAALLFDAPIASFLLLLAILIVTTIAISSIGVLYGALATGHRARDTLLPLLVLPVLAPVLLGATSATDSALFGSSGDAWAVVSMVGAFALLYTVIGIVSFGLLLEDS